MSQQFKRQEVTLDEATEELLHELFQSKETKGILLEHYSVIAQNYGKVIAQSPYKKPPVEIFMGMVTETFIENVTTLLYGMKSSILFNVTVSEERGLTYKEIAQNLTDLMVEYEKEIKKAENIQLVKESYAKQVKFLKKQGII